MRNSARGIIIRDNAVLTMFRRKVKEGKVTEYYVLPGGGIEDGENSEETVVRELKEEMSVDIEILGYLGKDETEQGDAIYYHCKIKNDADPKLGGEELERMTESNYYEPRFVSIENLDKINIYGADYIYRALKKEYK
ncbi:MAG: NUDIX domain-containing protein [Clostridia bacterium]|jgi:ADP-ribose pyrophosphatase YjhB (NUDIX family)|nr:NUDIX domain-containing protein [Clostridia bacterium]